MTQSEIRTYKLEHGTFLLKASTQVKTTEKSIGSGFAVVVDIYLKNTNSNVQEVVFPAGLVIISQSNSYQNGVLLKKASALIPGNETAKIRLVMYCGNLQRGPSFTSAQYRFGVVSNSSLIMDLCSRLANKKINVEKFNINDILEIIDISKFTTYIEQENKIQVILHNLTDRALALSEEDIQYLNNLPNS